MGKKRYKDANETETMESEDVAAEHMKDKNWENSQIVDFVKPGKKQRKSESEISCKDEPNESEELVGSSKKGKRKRKSEGKVSCKVETNEQEYLANSNEKSLRFNIDGEIVKPENNKGGSENKSDAKAKIKKPRWTAERKLEERKRKALEFSDKPEDVKPTTKKPKKHRKEKEQHNQQSTNSLATSAIQYLQNWQYDRSSWKFSKVKQTWLLKNMFDLRKVPSSIFPTLVEYIGGSKGGSRLKTYEAASKIIQKLEEKLSSGETEEEEIQKCLTEDSEEDKEEIHQRARSIMQALSDCI